MFVTQLCLGLWGMMEMTGRGRNTLMQRDINRDVRNPHNCPFHILGQRRALISRRDTSERGTLLATPASNPAQCLLF